MEVPIRRPSRLGRLGKEGITPANQIFQWILFSRFLDRKQTVHLMRLQHPLQRNVVVFETFKVCVIQKDPVFGRSYRWSS